jgi:hypothetical protein
MTMARASSTYVGVLLWLILYSPDLFRPHYGGVESDNDIHIEAYDRDVQTRLESKSVFLAEGCSHTAAERQQPIPH